MSLVIRRSHATLGGLTKYIKRLPKQVKKMIVEALIFPHLMYCLFGLGVRCGKMQRHRVQNVVNHCAQVVLGTQRSFRAISYIAPDELMWTNIDQLVSECDMHTILNSPHAPVSLRECLVYRTDVTERNTRAVQTGNLQV